MLRRAPNAAATAAATIAATIAATTAAAVVALSAAPAIAAPYPQLLPAAQGTGPTNFVPAIRWRGRTAVWIARTASGIALLSFDERLVELRLHSGTADAGPTGWHWGPDIAPAEQRLVVGAFNGGFKLSGGDGGFLSYGRVGAPLRNGDASVVTYTNGYTDVGAWGAGVPAAGRAVASVRQNLTLLISGGHAANDLGCLICWGATLGGVVAPARSALGITADGHLIWAGGEHLTVAQLAGALLDAHVVRALELDINPAWVNAYLYGHRGGPGPLAPVAIVPGQNGIPGAFLTPWSRDFFSVEAR